MLTDSQIKKIKPTEGKTAPDRYNDGNNLYLHVFSSGGKRWIMDYRFEGKRKTYSIGTYPNVSLAMAREKRDDARKLLNQGIDPNAAKKEAKRIEDKTDSFAVIARAWLEHRKPTIQEGGHKRNVRMVESDLIPLLGDMPIKDIKPSQILAAAEKVQERGAGEIARRIVWVTGSIFAYAKTRDLVEHDPTWGVVEQLKPREQKNMARIPFSEMPVLLQKIDHYDGEPVTRIGLQLLALTFVRTKELRFMEWTEIDRDALEWRIPADKMKMGAMHIVPLSRQVLALLDELAQYTGGSKYAFHSGRTQKPLSENTFIYALYRMGYHSRMTAHGFRGVASTYLHEKGYLHEAIERQLAHGKVNKVSAAYDHSEHLTYRRTMMQEWADVLDDLRGGKVIPFPKVAG